MGSHVTQAGLELAMQLSALLSLPSFQHAGTMQWPTGWPRQPCFCNDWYFTGWETQEPSDFQWVIKDTVGSMAGASSNANPLRSSLGTVWRGPTYDSMERHSINGEINQDVHVCLREGLKHRERSRREMGNEENSKKSSLCVISRWELL